MGIWYFWELWLYHRHDTHQGFVPSIIPTQQLSTSLASHSSSLDSTQTSSEYLPPNWRGANLQDSPTTKVEIIKNRILKLVACTLVIKYEVDSHISNPWSHVQPTHAVQGHGTKDLWVVYFQNFHAFSQSLDPTFLYSNSIFLVLVFLIVATKDH